MAWMGRGATSALGAAEAGLRPVLMGGSLRMGLDAAELGTVEGAAGAGLLGLQAINIDVGAVWIRAEAGDGITVLQGRPKVLMVSRLVGCHYQAASRQLPGYLCAACVQAS